MFLTVFAVSAIAISFFQLGALSIWVVILKAILAVAAAVALPLAHALVVSSHNDTGL
jgi:hypothetical protein